VRFISLRSQSATPSASEGQQSGSRRDECHWQREPARSLLHSRFKPFSGMLRHDPDEAANPGDLGAFAMSHELVVKAKTDLREFTELGPRKRPILYF
jgi:hypothetical protein